ncbi:MAG TPA: glutamine amidotransferase family protein [Dehalococcoidia bacterium]|nr:glutamine amidotransferase family protein [Dehalococcoidia bacterium]
MAPYFSRNNPYREDKVIEACSLFGLMDRTGRRFSGEDAIRAIANMHDRGNGLGGGFAAYGIYPQHAGAYAFHIMFEQKSHQYEVEDFLKHHFSLITDDEIPTRPTAGVTRPPVLWRYFLEVEEQKRRDLSEDDYVVEKVMAINTCFEGAFVFSSGKNMGVFKGVGYPEDVGRFFRLEEYEGYIWTAHGRFPTNTPGWWGGAHPFNILDWTVVHNGEISSYGTNRRFLEMYGYQCTMHTDTEVMAYAVDLLIRKHGLPVEMAAKVMAAPLWSEIDRMPEEEKAQSTVLRQVYPSLLMNGPFTVVIAHQGEMIGLTDRIRLRPLTVGVKGPMLYLSSEESAIRLICPDLDKAWIPMGGEPIIGRLGGSLKAEAVQEEELVASKGGGA